MNAQIHDVTTYEPSIIPAAVYARRGLDGSLDDTLETGLVQVEEDDAPALGKSTQSSAPRASVQGERVRVSGRRQAPAEQPGDTALVAVGAGLVSAMMALLMMLASGYGAA